MRTSLRTLPCLGLLLAGPALAMEDLPPAATPTEAPAAPAPAVAQTARPAGDEDLASVALLGYATASQVGAFRVERGGFTSPDAPQGTFRAQARADVRSWFGDVALESAAALDLIDGTHWQTTTAKGDRLPGSRAESMTIQDLWAGVRYQRLAGLRAGLMTSQWGLGLVANDGRDGLVPGRTDWFTLPRGGDRVARVQVHAMPWSGQKDSPLRGLLLTAAWNRVLDDDTVDPRMGQEGDQLLAAARLFLSPKESLGAFYAYRTGERLPSGQNPGGGTLTAHVIDLHADLDWRKDGDGLRLQAEAAFITGETTLAPTPEFPTHTLQQGGAMARAEWHQGAFRSELDLLWTSGDEDLADADVTAFRADRNLRQGLVLFEHVLAWQTGRARLRASDPNIVGQGPPDVDLYSTDGAVTGALTLFPKAGYRALDWLEVYGGVLVALATARPVDPFATQAFGGGQARNALGATPDGRLLGTEFDVGVRATVTLPKAVGANLRLGAEYGLLLPGGALDDPDQPLGAVQATRVTLALVGR